MEKREQKGDKRRYENFLPSSSTLQVVELKLDKGFRKRLGKNKSKDKNTPR